MAFLYYVLAAGVLLWLLVALHVCRRTKPGHKHRLAHEEANINPKCNLGRAASVYSIQGQRSHMEDAYYGDHTKGFFGVYDGHGGARCSSYAAQNLHELVFKHNYQEQPQLALQEGFKELDRHWLEMAALNMWDDGSTGVVALVVGRTLYVANAGDSRAVLCTKGGQAVDLSSDHKPAREDEKARIEKLGGRIIHYGTWRVQGVLAVTRAFGDRKLKQYVSAEPEIKSWELTDDDDFLVLATDGVWDVLSSQAAVDIVRQAMGGGGPNGAGNGSGSSTSQPMDVKGAAECLTNAAYSYHSADNITSLVVNLAAYRNQTAMQYK